MMSIEFHHSTLTLFAIAALWRYSLCQFRCGDVALNRGRLHYRLWQGADEPPCVIDSNQMIECLF